MYEWYCPRCGFFASSQARKHDHIDRCKGAQNDSQIVLAAIGHNREARMAFRRIERRLREAAPCAPTT